MINNEIIINKCLKNKIKSEFWHSIESLIIFITYTALLYWLKTNEYIRIVQKFNSPLYNLSISLYIHILSELHHKILIFTSR